MPSLKRLLRRDAAPAGEHASAGHELRYWLQTGLDKGTGIYANYLTLFGVEPDSFRGLTVADFGCGPFGGVLSALEDLGTAYPIDVLADEYNELGRSPWPVVPVVDSRTPLPASTCDACFCTNALDHVPDPERIAAELARILRPGGTLFLHLHLRRPDQLNKAHRYVVSEDDVRGWFAPWFDLERSGVEADWPNDEPSLTMFFATLRRRAGS